MIKGFKAVAHQIMGMKLEVGNWVAIDTKAKNALIVIKGIYNRNTKNDCLVLVTGAIYDELAEAWGEWDMYINCLEEANQLQEYFEGELLEVVTDCVNSAIAEFELQGVTYGIYNGNTPIFIGIESYGKAQAVLYNTAKACKILGLRCDLVNEKTGEVIS